MEISLVVSLVGIGLFLILIELFLIPGTTVVGFIGFFASLVGIYFGYRYFGVAIGTGIAIGSIMVAAFGFHWAIKIGAWKLFSLKENVEGSTTNIDENLSIGDLGVTTSALRPSGEALFGNDTSEVTSYGEFIESETPIKNY